MSIFSLHFGFSVSILTLFLCTDESFNPGEEDDDIAEE